MKKYKRYTYDERVALIKDCRQSGLSDYQWRHQNGIPSSTFYNRIKQLRKSACSSKPVIPKRAVSVAAPKQEIVKLNVAEEPQGFLCQTYTSNRYLKKPQVLSYHLTVTTSRYIMMLIQIF